MVHMEEDVLFFSPVSIFKDFTNKGNLWLNVCILGTTVYYNVFPASGTSG